MQTRAFAVLILFGIAKRKVEGKGKWILAVGQRRYRANGRLIDTVSYKINSESVLNLTFYKCLGPILQKTPLNQSATLPPPTVEISSTTDLPPGPTTAQAENITTSRPAVVTNTSSNVY